MNAKSIISTGDKYYSMNKIEVDKNITVSGNSLILKVTKELRLMDLKEGDRIHVTLEKIN